MKYNRTIITLALFLMIIAPLASSSVKAESWNLAAGEGRIYSLGDLERDDWLNIEWTIVDMDSNDEASITIYKDGAEVDSFWIMQSNAHDEGSYTIDDDGDYHLEVTNENSFESLVVTFEVEINYAPGNSGSDAASEGCGIIYAIIGLGILGLSSVMIVGKKKEEM